MAGAEEADAAVDAGGGRHRDMQARLDEGCVEDVGVDRAGSVQSGGHLARWWLQDLSVVLERSGCGFRAGLPAGPRTNVYHVNVLLVCELRNTPPTPNGTGRKCFLSREKV